MVIYIWMAVLRLLAVNSMDCSSVENVVYRENITPFEFS